MSKLFRANGFLSEEGQRAFAPVAEEIKKILASSDMTESELRVIGANLASLAGNLVSSAMQAKREKT